MHTRFPPLISVIVPIYRVEAYIRPCLDSLLAQTCADFEVILVNDATPDRSFEIARDYAERDARFRLLSQANEGPEPRNVGLGAARNAGLRVASGEFVAFLDSDDYLAPTALSELTELARSEGADCIVGGIVKVWDDGRREPFAPGGPLEAGRYQSQAERERFLRTATAWGKLYKRSFLRDNRLLFPEGVYFEDEPFTFLVAVLAELIVATPTPYYFYRQRELSILSATQGANKRVDDIFRVVRLIREQAKERGLPACWRAAAERRGRELLAHNYHNVTPPELRARFRARVLIESREDYLVLFAKPFLYRATHAPWRLSREIAGTALARLCPRRGGF